MLYLGLLFFSLAAHFVSSFIAACIFLGTECPERRFNSYIVWIVIIFAVGILSLLFLPHALGQLMYGFSFTFLLIWCIFKHDKLLFTKHEELELE